MRLLLASLPDAASVNIMERLQEAADWEEVGDFHAKPVLRNGSSVMTSMDLLHLSADDVDKDLTSSTGIEIEEIVFLSKHKAASGIRTLTVHPIGNYGKAEFGGREGELVKSSPSTMTGLLRGLATNSAGLPFKVSYEVTHHGPWLSTPSVFIEIGSGEGDWGHEGAAAAIAKSILELQRAEGPVVVGIGGGHYAPRFTEISFSRKVAFGHMIPIYAIEEASDASATAMMLKATKASGTDMIYVHRKSMSGAKAKRLKELATSAGLRTVESEDLEPL
ncbi:MAG: D-aminoacyl-tRNA deacylase [Euryarchaeota archaeon]|nr:D-aminoacyl-tRNA deacylase [Euryarchaeota archaeon]